MDQISRIFIVGHGDIIERSLCTYLRDNGYEHVLSSSEIGLDTTIQPSVYEFFQKHRPEYVFMGPTRAGGIEANEKFGAEFMYHNLESQNNILYASWKFNVTKLLYFGATCIYPKECAQPIKEEYLLTGPLEKTSEPYSLAKIAGVKLCQAFKKQYRLNTAVMVPATIYGPGSDVDIKTAHVMGALIGKFVEAADRGLPDVSIWGTGNPRREFLYIDDFIDAALYVMKNCDGGEIIHAGSGQDVAIKDLAQMIAGAVGYNGQIVFDETRPDGTMQKLLDSSRLAQLGWTAKVPLEEGIQKMCKWYKEQNIEGATQ